MRRTKAGLPLIKGGFAGVGGAINKVYVHAFFSLPIYVHYSCTFFREGLERSMLAQRLRKARKARGMTQEELAAQVRTTKGTISNYENSHSTPPNDMLLQLADVLHVTTDWLLGRTDEETPFSLATPAAVKEQRSLDELLQEKIEDPDDYYFLDGYLEASEEEKKEIRRYWYDLKKQWKTGQVKESRPPSLFDITETMRKKPQK